MSSHQSDFWNVEYANSVKIVGYWRGNACITHCCLIHGCKYRHENCPVESGFAPQAYPCEDCSYHGYGLADFKHVMRSKKDKRAILLKAAALLTGEEREYLEWLVRKKPNSPYDLY